MTDGEQDTFVSLATDEALRLVRDAIEHPERYCPRITAYPRPLRQMEPMSRWQARAVLAAIGRDDLLRRPDLTS